MTLNESPAFLLLDTDISHQHKELPVALYESGENPLFPANDAMVEAKKRDRTFIWSLGLREFTSEFNSEMSIITCASRSFKLLNCK